MTAWQFLRTIFLSLILPILLLFSGIYCSEKDHWNEVRCLVICGGNLTNEIAYTFVEKCGGKNAKILVIPPGGSLPNCAKPIQLFSRYNPKSIQIIGTDRKIPSGTSGIWLTGGDQVIFEKDIIGTQLEQDICDFYYYGGIIGGNSAGASFMSRVMIRDDEELGCGLNLFSFSIIDQHFDTRQNRMNRLRKAVERNPLCKGYGIDEQTALIVENSSLSVIGKGHVIVMEKKGALVQTSTAP